MSVAKQALGFVEEKLRRVFRLAGPIGVDLDPIVKPVIVVDDLRDPGHAFYQGRSWVSLFNGNSGVGTNFLSVQFNDDVLIEAFFVVGELAASTIVQVYHTTPLQQAATPPTIVTAAFSAWRDGKILAPDKPPIFNNVSWQPLQVGGTDADFDNLLMWWQAPAAGPQTLTDPWPLKIFIQRGGALIFKSAGDNLLTVGCFGRVWPQ